MSLSPKQAEVYGRLQQTIYESRRALDEADKRIEAVEQTVRELFNSCAHPRAVDKTMMGMEKRLMECTDCGEQWEDAYEGAYETFGEDNQGSDAVESLQEMARAATAALTQATEATNERETEAKDAGL